MNHTSDQFMHSTTVIRKKTTNLQHYPCIWHQINHTQAFHTACVSHSEVNYTVIITVTGKILRKNHTPPDSLLIVKRHVYKNMNILIIFSYKMKNVILVPLISNKNKTVLHSASKFI